MKTALTIVIFVCCVPFLHLGQNRDKFGVLVDLSIGFVPMKLQGTSEVSSNGIAQINGHDVANNPVYEYKVIRTVMLNSSTHLSLNLPLHKTENWSLGLKIGAGIGSQKGFNSVEDLTSIIFDFPQYAYFKHNGDQLEYSILLGYKYAFASLPYQLVIAGFEYHFNLENSLRFYTSFIGNRYYNQYSNGDLKPAIKSNEFGFVLIHKFSRK